MPDVTEIVLIACEVIAMAAVIVAGALWKRRLDRRTRDHREASE